MTTAYFNSSSAELIKEDMCCELVWWVYGVCASLSAHTPLIYVKRLIVVPGADGMSDIGWKCLTRTSKFYTGPLIPQTLTQTSICRTTSIVVFALWILPLTPS